MPSNSSNLFGFPVYVNRFLCDGGAFLRWRRNHRKSRINKKWHKKYGCEVTKCSCPVYQVENSIVTCPHGLEKLKEVTDEEV